MLILNPRRVSFGGSVWGQVQSVVIGRSSEKLLAEWSDVGPHAVLVDVVEQRVRVEVVQEMLGDDMDEPKPGEMASLSFTTSPTSTDANRREVSMTAVVTGVSYEVSLRRGAVRKVDLVAVSGDGVADPVTVVDV